MISVIYIKLNVYKSSSDILVYPSQSLYQFGLSFCVSHGCARTATWCIVCMCVCSWPSRV